MTIAEVFEGYDAVGLGRLIAEREITPAELVDEALRRVELLNPRLNALNFVDAERARAAAAGVTPTSPLSGVPFVLKDLAVEWEGFPVTNGSRYFKDYVASGSWTLAERLRDGGLIPLGKSNVPEGGWAGTTEPAFHGPTVNPWDPSRIPGGSSGGSSVAVASRMVPIADASDGGGSIRIPASINGVVGLKPSRGRVTFGPTLTDFWYGSACFLCVSRSVRDTAAYLDIVAGAEPGEPYALPSPDVPYGEVYAQEPGRLRIGVITSGPDGAPPDEDVAAAVGQAAGLCRDLGHDVDGVDVRFSIELLGHVFCRIGAVSAAATHAFAAGAVGHEVTPEDVEPVTWEMIRLGRSITGPEHYVDVELMRGLARDYVRQQREFDVVLAPVLPESAPETGFLDMQNQDLETYNDRMTRGAVFTAPVNLSGQPAITLPIGTTADGRPVGVQFIGRMGAEDTLLRLAATLERAAPWADRRPPVTREMGL
ncbi:amidase [Tsukamurella sp. 8F]|uniref:amidase n=1 Tax=unclassified Tsukamurella TaxID=2633480 RepID=UPI0023B9CF9E|nr:MULTISPECIES: amidase [unclassified Tsukamurella]MDF0531859.1 amidase [Tsukamurella sp. 8J]MDF0589521.1 amidase [Tsukamurella sp. 8F]